MWLSIEWTIFCWLHCNSSNRLCNWVTSETTAVPNSAFNMVPPKLSRPRRGSSLGRICLKLCNFDSSVVRSVSIDCSSEVKVKSFLCRSTASKSPLMVEIASSYGFRSILIAIRQESSVRKICFFQKRNTSVQRLDGRVCSRYAE